MPDERIYGIDSNDFAESVASDALGKPNSNAHSGNPVDQSAKSKGHADAENPDARVISDKSDSRAKSKGN